MTELCQYLDSDLVFSDLKSLPLCSEITTVDSGPAPYQANIAFIDHLVAKPSENPLDSATSTPLKEAGRKTQCRLQSHSVTVFTLPWKRAHQGVSNIIYYYLPTYVGVFMAVSNPLLTEIGIYDNI